MWARGARVWGGGAFLCVSSVSSHMYICIHLSILENILSIGGAAGKSYAQQPKNNPHHYLDFPSRSNSREAQTKGRVTSLSAKAPRFGGEGNLNTHPTPTHGKDYVQLPKSNPHHYLDFPSSANPRHVEHRYADEPSSSNARRPQRHYLVCVCARA